MKRIYRLLFVLLFALSFAVAAAEDDDYDDDDYQDDAAEADSSDSGDDELTLDTAEEILRQHRENTQIEEIDQRVASLLKQSSEVQSLQENLLERTAALQGMIRQINAIQLNSLVSQLNQTVERQIAQRVEGNQRETPQSVDKDQEGVPLGELEQVLSPTSILEDSEKELEAWILGLITEEVIRQQQELSQNPKASCVGPVEAVEKVQESLTKHQADGVGRFDHAQGATIVYEQTSDTYVPPASPNRMVGNSSWRRYIPQDWERLLPTGWEKWTADVPSFISHSLGLKSGGPAPPEEILNPGTNVGSCWPLPGRQGQVLLRLSRPIKVDAVTLDHVSRLLLQDDAMGSAPRHVKVVGYPPCNDEKCQGMGFDMNQPTDLVSFEYKMDGDSSSTQTFQVSGEDEGGPECSAAATSCSAPPEVMLENIGHDENVVSGILVEVQDNWGNEDYTCIYRFRVHGDPVQ